jgi:hypothetical protein
MTQNEYENELCTIVLTNDQRITLDMYLLMTTNYRKKEHDACQRFGSELDEHGNIKYPNIASNAIWWDDAIKTIDEIIELLKH